MSNMSLFSNAFKMNAVRIQMMQNRGSRLAYWRPLTARECTRRPLAGRSVDHKPS